MNVPTAKDPHDIVQLRELVNATQRTILSMRAAGIALEDFPIIYETKIRSALPPTVVFDFEERDRQFTHNSSGETAEVTDQRPAKKAAVRLTALLDFLRRYVCPREQLSATGQTRRQRESVDTNGTNRTAWPAPAQQTVVPDGSSKSRRQGGHQHRNRHNYTMASTLN